MTREHIKALRRERRQAQRARRHAAFARVSYIPELLSSIFFYCLPKDGLATPTFRHAPLKFTLVCKHWRDVALTSPVLWSGLRLRCRVSYPHEYSNRQRDALDYWLLLSGNHPFSFCLRYGRAGNDDLVDHIVTTLLTASSRWRDVDVTVPLWVTHQLVIKLSDATPLLERIRITTTPVSRLRAPIRVSASLDISKAPKLRSFEFMSSRRFYLTCIGIPTGLKRMVLDLKAFTLEHRGNTVDAVKYLYLRVDQPSAEAFSQCSKSFPELCTLVCDLGHPATLDCALHKPIVFPSVRKICLKLGRAREGALDMSIFLNMLTLPSLVSLKYLDSNEESWPRLADLLSRIHTPLRSIDTNDNRYRGVEVHGIIQRAADWTNLNPFPHAT